MRVQFTNKEQEIIDSKEYNDVKEYIPASTQDEIITMGLKVIDPYKFNMFIEKFLTNPQIKDQIGAECVHVDLKEPITRDKLYMLYTAIGEMISPTKKQEVPEEPVEENTEEEYSEDDSDDEDYGEVSKETESTPN